MQFFSRKSDQRQWLHYGFSPVFFPANEVSHKQPKQRLGFCYLWKFFWFLRSCECLKMKIKMSQCYMNKLNKATDKDSKGVECTLGLTAAGVAGLKCYHVTVHTESAQNKAWMETDSTGIHSSDLPTSYHTGVNANQPIVAHCAPYLLTNHWPSLSMSMTSPL